MKQRASKKTPSLFEEKVLRAVATPSVYVSEAEARYDLDTTSAQEYDDMFYQALRERESESVRAGYGEIQHPTSRLFEIGVDSIRAGKPSELFLLLLEQIGKMAEERDVMTALFPDEFPRRIKMVTIRAAQREARIVEEFKEHVRKYLSGPRTAKDSGSDGLDASWEWVERTYAEAVADFKRGLELGERKALDRALKNQGATIIEWRDRLARRL